MRQHLFCVYYIGLPGFVKPARGAATGVIFVKVKFLTLGCKVNQYETEAMLESLLRQGFQPAGEGEAADVVAVNSCTVTAQSDQKARQALRRLKRQNPGAVAVLTGCWPQAFPEEAAGFSEADIVLGNVNRAELGGHILRYLSSKQRIVDIRPHEKGEAFENMEVRRLQGHTRAFLKIEDGCERFCSYCVIPFARGRVRSKALEDVRREVAALARSGYKEVVLAGINLPAYGQDLGLSLCDAVEAACGCEGIARVRLGSLEPERLAPAVIARMRAQEKLCPQFHLSLQSGCGATLKRMNRHYTPAEYREIASNLREAFPGCAITTDVMVGFPGETEEEFAESLAFVKEMGFARTHVFAYSRRPGTAADRAPGQVEGVVKERRAREMAAAAAACQRAFYQGQVGKTETVLVEEEAGEGVYRGYTGNYTPVRVESGRQLAGALVEVELTAAAGDGMTGRLAE